MGRNRTPQDRDFNISKTYELIASIMYTIMALLAIIQEFIHSRHMVIVSICLIIIIFCLEYRKDKIYDNGTKTRRDILLDNAFNQSYNPEESQVRYYDNDQIEPGLERLFWNVYESVFFSQKILKKMIEETLLLLIIPVGVLMYSIFLNGLNSINAAVVTLVFSNMILKRIIVLRNTKNSVERIYEQCSIIANEIQKKQSINENIRNIMSIIIDYESTMSENKYGLSNRLFLKHVDTLNNDWYKIRDKYLNKN